MLWPLLLSEILSTSAPWCGNDGTDGARYKRFVANALWSKDRLHHAGKIGSTRCLRCGADVESVHHVLWTCHANSMVVDRLRRAWVALEPSHAEVFTLPDDFPFCITVCGLIPSPLPTGISTLCLGARKERMMSVLGNGSFWWCTWLIIWPHFHMYSRVDGLVPLRLSIFPFHLSEVRRLPRKVMPGHTKCCTCHAKSS